MASLYRVGCGDRDISVREAGDEQVELQTMRRQDRVPPRYLPPTVPPHMLILSLVCEANRQHLILQCSAFDFDPHRHDHSIFQHSDIEAVCKDVLGQPQHLVKLAQFDIASSLAHVM